MTFCQKFTFLAFFFLACSNENPKNNLTVFQEKDSINQPKNEKLDTLIYLSKIDDLQDFSKNFKEINFEVQKISIDKKENFKYSRGKIDSKYNQIMYDFLKTNNRHFLNIDEEFYPYFKMNIDSNRIGFAITYQVSSIAEIPPVDLFIFNKKSGSFEQIIKLMETYICGSIYQVESRIEDINQDQKLDFVTIEQTFTQDSTQKYSFQYLNNGIIFEKQEKIELKANKN